MIIVISGKQGSGKSTLTNELLKRFGPCGAIKMRFAQPLYEMHDACRAILAKYNVQGYNFSVKDGELLQVLGTEWARKTIHDKIWINCLMNQIRNLPKNLHCLIEDTRFQNEFDAFKDVENALTVRLECPTILRKVRCENWRSNDTHLSETDLDAYAEAGKFDLYFKTDQLDVATIADQIVAHINQKIVHEINQRSEGF